jgi:hypothetical protein
MSRHHSNSPHEKTLGYFLHGAPVIFVEIEIAMRSHPYLLEYLEFNRACDEQQIKDPSLPPHLCRGFEYFVTIEHEIRHFHDALLCTPLFERFLLQNQIAWCVAQIIPKIPPEIERIPINWHDPKLATLTDIELLKQIILGFDEMYFSKFAMLNDPCTLMGHNITLDYLIETNAIVTELVHLYAVHGIRSTRDYYENVIVHLPDPKYTLLIDCFRQLYGDVIGAMAALYMVIPFCLYSSSNPTEKFCELVDIHKAKPNSIYQVCNPIALKKCFDDEASLEHRIQDMMLRDFDGRPIEPTLRNVPDKEFAKELIDFHRTMYGCRRKLIDKYIGEFDYKGNLYCERLNELPIPPMLFFPEVSGGGNVKGIHELEFHKRNLPLYKIAAYPGDDPANQIVFAGLTSLPGTEPAIRFDVADIQLIYAYFYNAAFQGKTSFYAPIIDRMYEKLLRESS